MILLYRVVTTSSLPVAPRLLVQNQWISSPRQRMDIQIASPKCYRTTLIGPTNTHPIGPVNSHASPALTSKTPPKYPLPRCTAIRYTDSRILKKKKCTPKSKKMETQNLQQRITKLTSGIKCPSWSEKPSVKALAMHTPPMNPPPTPSVPT
ncbi:hypothetical protein BDP81DRAFT_157038 [Colletotrichum phormii]|uniref:Uncharacterized protein n=1 Tax=Colletotrichum phormii TaxID=359342 RepID=A0AAJ0EH43_9PEZI|nr:uncharacterized protein BDP81DRAFT_157038 [Colletotrichum phormii]KAK1640012.1 hypothetical protein BDP81DRAFT_157038 [Colletotrichum phormii]